MLDSIPGKFADMDEAIYAADIHESTKIGEIAHCALINLADFNIVPDLFRLLLAFFAEQGSS